MFYIVNRSNKIFQGFYLSCNLIKMMSVLNIFSDGEIHLLQCIQSFHDLTKLMLSVYLIYWIVQVFQVSYISVNFSEAMSSCFHCVNRALQGFKFSNFILYFSKFVFPVNIVNWIIESTQISQNPFNILEAVLVFYRVYRTCHLLDII